MAVQAYPPKESGNTLYGIVSGFNVIYTEIGAHTGGVLTIIGSLTPARSLFSAA